MRIDSNALSELVFRVACEQFGDRTFRRRALMNRAESEVRRLGYWEDRDDELSNSVGSKSMGLADIDYRFSDLSRTAKLVSERRDVWKVHPQHLAEFRNADASSKRVNNLRQFLGKRGIQVSDFRLEGESAPNRIVLQVTNPLDDLPSIARVFVSWNNAGGKIAANIAKTRYGINHLSTLKNQVIADRKCGITHYLISGQNDGEEVAVLIPIDVVTSLWADQSVISSQHAHSGDACTLWLNDPEHPELADSVWETEGVQNLSTARTLDSRKGDAASGARIQYLTRIAFNGEGWQRPSGHASDLEEDGTYNQTNGFGHEEWLFRNEWLIDGWRYGFLQGVNKSYEKLVRDEQPFDVLLFTIDDQKRRRYVATIRSVECLSPDEAEEALKAFKAKGWFDTMRREIKAVDGNESTLGTDLRAKHVLNVRFRVENIVPSPADDFAQSNDPVQHLNRYNLNGIAKLEAKHGDEPTPGQSPRGRKGQEDAPISTPFTRRATAATTCTPEHAKIQTRLFEELKLEYPDARVVCEEDYVDVMVETKAERLLFEIKSDRDSRAVIRQALGQILDYAFHPGRNHPLPVRLFIVGRARLRADDQRYLDYLQTKFGLPVAYRRVEC